MDHKGEDVSPRDQFSQRLNHPMDPVDGNGSRCGVETWLVGGWTNPLKNISQIGSFPQIGLKIPKNIWETTA